MQAKAHLGAALFLGVAACGNTLGTGGTTGSGGDTSGSGGSGEVTTGNGGGGGSVGSSGSGGGGTCELNPGNTTDLAVVPPPGISAPVCADINPITFDGKVRTQGGYIYVDTCGPAADCVGNEARIQIGGSLFSADDVKSIPDGTFVHVVWSSLHAVSPASSPCGEAVLLRNLPTWQGVANPTASHTSLWLFATNAPQLSQIGAPDDRTALTVEEPVQCTSKDLEPVVAYNIKLTATDANVSVEAMNGHRVPLTIPSGAQKGEYAVINDQVGRPGNLDLTRSYFIVRQGP